MNLSLNILVIIAVIWLLIVYFIWGIQNKIVKKIIDDINKYYESENKLDNDYTNDWIDEATYKVYRMKKYADIWVSLGLIILAIWFVIIYFVRGVNY